MCETCEGQSTKNDTMQMLSLYPPGLSPYSTELSPYPIGLSPYLDGSLSSIYNNNSWQKVTVY